MDKQNKKTEVVEFEGKLRELIDRAPDRYARHDLYRALHFLRKRYYISPEKKKEVVLALIADGITTFTELVVETGYTRHQVERSLKLLLDEKKIRSSKISVTGKGRPRLSYFLQLGFNPE